MKNKGIDWTKENLADALGRPDLKKLLAQALGSLGGKASSKKLTPKQRSERARNAGKAPKPKRSPN